MGHKIKQRERRVGLIKLRNLIKCKNVEMSTTATTKASARHTWHRFAFEAEEKNLLHHLIHIDESTVMVNSKLTRYKRKTCNWHDMPGLSNIYLNFVVYNYRRKRAKTKRLQMIVENTAKMEIRKLVYQSVGLFVAKLPNHLPNIMKSIRKVLSCFAAAY